MDYEKYFPIRSLKLAPEIRVRSVVKTVQYPMPITNDNAPYALPYWHSQALARFILDNPQVFSGRSVVDIGCGTGAAAIAAAMVGAESLALDPDLRCLEFTEQNASTNGVTVKAVWGNHQNIPETDIIISGGVFHEPHGTAIAEIARKKPSLIAISEINLWDMNGFVEVALHRMDKSNVYVFMSKHLAAQPL
jgi:predicted nicotinamide N-methyase